MLVEPRSDIEVVAQGQVAFSRLLLLAKEEERRPASKASTRSLLYRNTGDPEHLRLWIEVGKAMWYGKKATTSGQAFRAWQFRHGFGVLGDTARSHSTWLGRFLEEGGVIPPGATHPSAIWQCARIKANEDRSGAKTELIAQDRAEQVLSETLKSLGKTARKLRSAAENLREDARRLSEAARLIERFDNNEHSELPPEFDALLKAATDVLKR